MSEAPGVAAGIVPEIAIVGMAGRFPGARDLAALWDNLRRGVESISRFTPEEMRAARVDPALAADPLNEPRRIASLAADLAHVEGLDLDRDLAWIQERGLVFPEGDKLMSLVLRREPPPMTYRARALSVRKTLKARPEPAIVPITRVARRAVKPGAGRIGA